MPHDRQSRAPVLYRALLRVASWFVPAQSRAEWYANWSRSLAGWWLLLERGEPLADEGALLSRRAIAAAFAERINRLRWERFVRGPWFVPLAGALGFALLAALTQGFAVSRSLLEGIRDLYAHPAAAVPYDARGNRIVAYLAPVLIAFSVGCALFLMGRSGLAPNRWRNWLFLAVKTFALYGGLSLIWIEGGTALRDVLYVGVLRFGVAGVGLAAVYIVACGRAVLWSLADQRSRCPVCLRRLALPVTIGSWASVFDPATTEVLCEDGHGALALTEAEAGGPDRWVEFETVR